MKLVNIPAGIMNFTLKQPIEITKKKNLWVSSGFLGMHIAKPSKEEVIGIIGRELLRLYRKLFMIHHNSDNSSINREREKFNNLVVSQIRRTSAPENVVKPMHMPPPKVEEKKVASKPVAEVMKEAAVEHKVETKKKATPKKTTKKAPAKKKPAAKKPAAKKAPAKKATPKKTTKKAPAKKSVKKKAPAKKKK